MYAPSKASLHALHYWVYYVLRFIFREYVKELMYLLSEKSQKCVLALIFT